ncbi:MAG: trypsin-like peptidase domain-containing protein [Planctomycetota bacterium]
MCALAVFAVFGLFGPCAQAMQSEEMPTLQATQEERAFARSLSRAFQAAAEAVDESVVHIKSIEDRPVVRRSLFGTFRDRVRRSGLGSGVIVSDDGYVLTNNHVIRSATTIEVRLPDGREVSAEVVGTDPLRDLAVLKIEASGLSPATFADSDAIQVGQWVIAVGSPFGLERSVTAGIISAKGRAGLGIVDENLKDVEEFIQTDAAINPGNSGGPLIDLDGRVVGINTAIFSRTGGSVGLGFAIPANLAQAVLDNLIEIGRVPQGFLGLRMEQDRRGVRVASVVEGSPAERAGLRQDDVITAYRGKVPDSPDGLSMAIQFTPPGTEAAIVVRRGGELRELAAVIGNRAEALAASVGGVLIGDLGIVVIDPDRGEGAVVIDVAPGSPADRVGVEPNDVVIEFGGRGVNSAAAMQRAVNGTPGREARITVLRNGSRASGSIDW